jgi:hypothetical protein
VTTDDRGAAEREARARRRLMDGGAADLPRPPWLATGQPPQAVDLLRHLLWRWTAGGRGAPTSADDVATALELVPAARAEIDQLESALLFAARAEGLPWARIADCLDLGSRQAAQQRFDRLAGRTGDGAP